MPGGIPVACVAIGKAGAKNAAYLSAQILAIDDAELAERLKTERETNAQLVRDKDHKLQTKLDKQNVHSAPD
jgi:5-(carboxyamino)imidazole ribonucleotide mutase